MLELMEVIDCQPIMLVDVFNQPLYQEYRIGPHPFKEEDARELYRQKVCNWHLGKEYTYVAIENDQVLGVASFHSISVTHKFAHIFYWFAVSGRGKGYATRTVIQLIHLGFKKWGFCRIEAQLRTDNAPSRRLLERLKFKQEAVLESKFINNNMMYDGFQYRLLLEEYEKGWSQEFPMA